MNSNQGMHSSQKDNKNNRIILALGTLVTMAIALSVSFPSEARMSQETNNSTSDVCEMFAHCPKG